MVLSRPFNLCTKWPATSISDNRKSTFDHISRHFRSIRNIFLNILFTKYDRKSLSIVFLAISDQYAKWLIGAFLIKLWSAQAFSSIFLKFCTKWPPTAILDNRKSLSIAFLAISYQYTTFFFKWPPAAISDDRK